MASPLAEIDWNNLQDENVVTAYNLLQLMYSERFNLSYLIGPRQSTPSGRASVQNKFPFIGNSPIYGSPSWPVTWGSHEGSGAVNGKYDQALQNYLDEEDISNSLGTSPAQGFRQDDVWLNESKIFSNFGISEWPRMDIPTAINAKLWYDILTSLKFITRAYKNGGVQRIRDFSESNKEGIFKTGTFSPIDYGGGGQPPISQLDSDWASLWTSPTTKELSGDDGITINYNYFSGFVDAYAVKSYFTLDNSDFVNTGHTGTPLSRVTYGSFSSSSNGDSSFDTWLTTNGYTDDKIISMPAPSVTSLPANEIEISIPFPVPSQPPKVNGGVNTRSQFAVYEDWDYDGGFTYFTPP